MRAFDTVTMVIGSCIELICLTVHGTRRTKKTAPITGVFVIDLHVRELIMTELILELISGRNLAVSHTLPQEEILA